MSVKMSFWINIPKNTCYHFVAGKTSFLKHEIFATYLRGNS